jgi:hypothetical protein
MRFWDLLELYAADTIAMPECGNDVVGIPRLRTSAFSKKVLYDDGQ